MSSVLIVCSKTRVVSRCTLAQKFYFCSNVVEQWMNIPNCNNYQVSSLGNIYNKKFSRFRDVNYKMFEKHCSRARVILPTDQGEAKNFLIARLVLLSFKPHSNSANLHANHIDGNYHNDTLDNLNWMTPSENMKHAHTLKRKQASIPVELIQPNGDVLKFASVKKCQIAMSLSYYKVSCLCAKQEFLDGYEFKYSNPDKYYKFVESLNGEEWKHCAIGATQQTYFISNYGRAKVKYRKNCIEKLKKTRTARKYRRITIGQTTISIHRLVATHFVPNPNGYQIVDHIDSNSLNNNASNLRWVESHAQNMNNENTKYKLSIARRERLRKLHFPILQLDKNNCKILNTWYCPSQLKGHGYKLPYILKVCRAQIGGNRTAYGYIWTFDGQQSKSKPFVSKALVSTVHQLSKSNPSIIIKQWTIRELQDAGYYVSNINSCCQGTRKSAHGHGWKYVES
eukprot:934668_1